MFRFVSKGDYEKTRKYLKRLENKDHLKNLNRFGEAGVRALAAATPQDTGRTATSWRYRIKNDRNRTSIEWYNTNSAGGVPVAILIQYGHGTGTGGYVRGRDYINPAMRPVFDKIANDFWKEVRAWRT